MNRHIKFIIFASTLIIVGCSQAKNYDSLKAYYEDYLRQSESNDQITSVQEEFSKIINSYPDTKYSSLARLRMAEILFNNLSVKLNVQADIDNAETFYQTFLIINPGHQLEPYILDRLMQINYIRSVEGFLVTGTDPQPNKDTLQIYKNSQLIHPNNVYQDDMQYIAFRAQDKLAEYEISVGDWYFGKKLYAASINRYEYVFKNYPSYASNKELANKLIESYRLNLQPDRAKSLTATYKDLFNK